jgi:hypothetical protein
MDNISREKIEEIVRDIVAELGVAVSGNDAKERNVPSRKGPRALIIFHAGIRKLDEAMKQVHMIDKATGKCSLFTGESARSSLCGEDVREKSGAHCLLDTVKPEGLEKVLSLADVLVLPTFCIRVAAKVAHFLGDNLESNIVLSALFQGKKVLASKDSFLMCEKLTNVKLQEEISRILGKLEGFGMVFCPTEKLSEVFIQLSHPGQRQETPVSSEVAEEEKKPGLKLITAKHIHAAVNEKRDSVEVVIGGMVTPLARDLAREYSIKIVET